MKLFTIILSLIILMACSLKQTTNEPGKENIELAKKSFAAFNKHNWEEHAAHFSDTCKYLDPSYGQEYKIVSRKNKAAKYKKMQDMSPDIHDEITCLFSSGNKVAIQFTSAGTAKTEKGNFKWSIPICCIFTFEKGLIVMDETYYDHGSN